MFSAERKITELQIVLPPAPGPAAKYVDCVVDRNILAMSGKGPIAVDNVVPTGKLGKDFSTEQGYHYARLVGINMLATLRAELGSLDRVERVLTIQGFINADPEFTEHHLVLNGLSDLLIEVFGDAGRHARSVLGANSLRDNLPVIAIGTFLLKE